MTDILCLKHLLVGAVGICACGNCKNCKGMTPSGSDKYCETCAKELFQCQICGESLVFNTEIALSTIDMSLQENEEIKAVLMFRYGVWNTKDFDKKYKVFAQLKEDLNNGIYATNEQLYDAYRCCYSSEKITKLN